MKAFLSPYGQKYLGYWLTKYKLMLRIVQIKTWENILLKNYHQKLLRRNQALTKIAFWRL